MFPLNFFKRFLKNPDDVFGNYRSENFRRGSLLFIAW